jgi:hypothetical protein
VVTAGQAGDSPQFGAVLGGIRVPRLAPGTATHQADRVLADKADSARANRALLRCRGIRATIPEQDDQAATGAAGPHGRPATGVRRGDLQAAPPGGVRDQPAHATPGGGPRYDMLAVG